MVVWVMMESPQSDMYRVESRSAEENNQIASEAGMMNASGRIEVMEAQGKKSPRHLSVEA